MPMSDPRSLSDFQTARAMFGPIVVGLVPGDGVDWSVEDLDRLASSVNEDLQVQADLEDLAAAEASMDFVGSRAAYEAACREDSPEEPEDESAAPVLFLAHEPSWRQRRAFAALGVLWQVKGVFRPL